MSRNFSEFSAPMVARKSVDSGPSFTPSSRALHKRGINSRLWLSIRTSSEQKRMHVQQNVSMVHKNRGADKCSFVVSTEHVTQYESQRRRNHHQQGSSEAIAWRASQLQRRRRERGILLRFPPPFQVNSYRVKSSSRRRLPPDP